MAKIRIYKIKHEGSGILGSLLPESNFAKYEDAKAVVEKAVDEWLPQFYRESSRVLINDYVMDNPVLGYKRQFAFKYGGWVMIVWIAIQPSWFYYQE